MFPAFIFIPLLGKIGLGSPTLAPREFLLSSLYLTMFYRPTFLNPYMLSFYAIGPSLLFYGVIVYRTSMPPVINVSYAPFNGKEFFKLNLVTPF